MNNKPFYSNRFSVLGEKLSRVILLAVTVLLLHGSLSANTRIDSLQSVADNVKNDSVRCFMLNDIALIHYAGAIAINTANDALVLAKRLNNQYLIAKSYSTLSWVHSFDDMVLKTKYLDSAIAISEAINDKEGLATIYNSQVAMLLEYGRYEEAIESLKKAYDLFDEIGMEERKIVVLNNWAVVLNEYGKPVEALKIADRAMQYRRTENPPSLLKLGRLEFVIGNSYKLLNEPNQAADHYIESYKYRAEAKSYAIAETLIEIAVLMMNEAEAGHDTLEIYKKIRKAGFVNSGALIDSAANVETVSERQQFTARLLDIRRKRAFVYGNYEKAYKYLEELKKYDDESKLSEENLSAFVGLKARYEQEQLKLQLLEEEILIDKRESQVKLLLAFLGLMFLLAVIGILTYQNRLRRKQLQLNKMKHEQQFVQMRATLEGEEKERARIARDLHDGLGNLLSTVKVTVGSLDIDMQNGQAEKFNRANHMIDEACSEIRKISHEMMPQALERYGITKALEDLVAKMDNAHGFSATFNVYGKERKLDDHTSLMIFRIAQEMLNNVIKYAKASQVTVQLSFGDELLDFTIEDDGVGFDINKVKKKNGMGLKSLAFRASDIDATYEVESKPGQGTMVSLSIPLAKATKNKKL